MLKIPLSTLHCILKHKDILKDKNEIKRVGNSFLNRDGIYKKNGSAVCKWVDKVKGKRYARNAVLVMDKANDFLCLTLM